MNEQKLREFVNEWCPVIRLKHHGFVHMRNVEAFGELLSIETNGVDKDIVHWFAYLHDIKREKDSGDLNHGERATEFIELIRNKYLSDLTNDQIEKLKKACALHTNTLKTDDPTIDVCFDADRLDLPRVYVKTDPSKMATEFGKKLAEENYTYLCRLAYPHQRDRLIFGVKYIVSNYRIHNLAIRFELDYNGLIVSPFGGRSVWTDNAKSVCVEGWYKKSGIYAIPLNEKMNNNIYYHLSKSENTIISLLEYDDEDIADYRIEEIKVTEEQIEKLKEDLKENENDKTLQESRKMLIQFIEQNDCTISKTEVCLKRCNIVFSAPYERFFDNIQIELGRYAQEKVDAYIKAKSMLDNYGNISIPELLPDIPELPSVTIS